MTAVPPVVANKAIATGAAQWLDKLPRLVAALGREWSFTLGAAHDGGDRGLRR